MKMMKTIGKPFDDESMEYKVPILAYLKKFILAEFYKGQAEPVKVEEDSSLGRLIMSILIDGRKVFGNRAPHFKDKEYTEHLRITLSSRMMERSPRINKLARINLEFDDQFRHAILIWMKAQTELGISSYASTQSFLEHYGIEEHEYSKDAAYKVWQRNQSMQSVYGKSRSKVIKKPQ